MHKRTFAGAAASALLYSSLFSVASAAVLPSPSCTISVPPGVHYANQTIRVLWVTQNAASASVTSIGQIPAAQIPQGYRDIPLTTNALLTMTVSNATATKTCSVIITVSKLPTQTQTVYQQVPVTQTRTVYQPVTQTTPTNTSSWAPLSNTWTPFYSTPTSRYGSLYDPSYGTSYYYTGDYYDYGSFYNSPYVNGSITDGYYYLSNPADCYYDGQCGQTGLYNPGYDVGTYSEQAANCSGYGMLSDGSGGCYDPNHYNTDGTGLERQLYNGSAPPGGTWMENLPQPFGDGIQVYDGVWTGTAPVYGGPGWDDGVYYYPPAAPNVCDPTVGC